MGLRTTLQSYFGTAWHVQGDEIVEGMTVATDGTVEANKPVVADANKDVTGGLRHLTATGTVTGATVNGTALQIGGTAIDATAAELNRVTDRSARSVSAGATLTLTEATHEGKTILLDTAAGSVITLPAPTVGARFRFLVKTMPTSNFHQVKVAAATDFMAGVANILDLDGATQGAFQADGTADDNIQLNGTTKGGQVGDWIEIEGITSTVWAIKAQLTCPAGSNPADMFSAAV